LIISPEPWEGNFVSKHHYAQELARRGHDVLFFGPPDEQGEIAFATIEGTWEGQLRVLRSPKVARGLRLMPGLLRRRLEANWLRQVEQKAGSRVEVVWLFENSRFYDMRFASERLKIYHQVDLNQDFHPETAAATADLAIAISQPIEARIKEKSQRFLRITHGCQAAQIDNLTDPDSLSRSKQIDAVFIAFPVNAVMTGNLDIPYLDLELLRDLVVQHPTFGFHFVGRYTQNTGLHALLGRAKNAIFWGFQPAHDLPYYLNQADVLLVAYSAQHHLDQLANPHKIMEYLVAGPCILASRTLEYESRPDLLTSADSPENFLGTFANIVKNLDNLNSPEQIAHRRAFAAENTYPRQLDRIASALGTQGNLIS
jgi:hypothetical protein